MPLNYLAHKDETHTPHRRYAREMRAALFDWLKSIDKEDAPFRVGFEHSEDFENRYYAAVLGEFDSVERFYYVEDLLINNTALAPQYNDEITGFALNYIQDALGSDKGISIGRDDINTFLKSEIPSSFDPDKFSSNSYYYATPSGSASLCEGTFSRQNQEGIRKHFLMSRVKGDSVELASALIPEGKHLSSDVVYASNSAAHAVTGILDGKATLIYNDFMFSQEDTTKAAANLERWVSKLRESGVSGELHLSNVKNARSEEILSKLVDIQLEKIGQLKPYEKNLHLDGVSLSQRVDSAVLERKKMKAYILNRGNVQETDQHPDWETLVAIAKKAQLDLSHLHLNSERHKAGNTPRSTQNFFAQKGMSAGELIQEARTLSTDKTEQLGLVFSQGWFAEGANKFILGHEPMIFREACCLTTAKSSPEDFSKTIVCANFIDTKGLSDHQDVRDQICAFEKQFGAIHSVQALSRKSLARENLEPEDADEIWITYTPNHDCEERTSTLRVKKAKRDAFIPPNIRDSLTHDSSKNPTLENAIRLGGDIQSGRDTSVWVSRGVTEFYHGVTIKNHCAEQLGENARNLPMHHCMIAPTDNPFEYLAQLKTLIGQMSNKDPEDYETPEAIKGHILLPLEPWNAPLIKKSLLYIKDEYKHLLPNIHLINPQLQTPDAFDMLFMDDSTHTIEGMEGLVNESCMLDFILNPTQQKLYSITRADEAIKAWESNQPIKWN